jgi:hypothetical protein
MKPHKRTVITVILSILVIVIVFFMIMPYIKKYNREKPIAVKYCYFVNSSGVLVKSIFIALDTSAIKKIGELYNKKDGNFDSLNTSNTFFVESCTLLDVLDVNSTYARIRFNRKAIKGSRFDTKDIIGYADIKTLHEQLPKQIQFTDSVK